MGMHLHFYNGSHWELIKGMENTHLCQRLKCVSIPFRETHLSSQPAPWGVLKQLDGYYRRQWLYDHWSEGVTLLGTPGYLEDTSQQGGHWSLGMKTLILLSPPQGTCEAGIHLLFSSV